MPSAFIAVEVAPATVASTLPVPVDSGVIGAVILSVPWRGSRRPRAETWAWADAEARVAKANNSATDFFARAIGTAVQRTSECIGPPNVCIPNAGA